MSFSVKDIINDAFDRTGIYPNPTETLPGEYFSMGLKLLRGLVSFYNTRNFIIPTQRMVEVTVPGSGHIRMAKTEEGVEPVIEPCASIQKVYIGLADDTNRELNFKSLQTWPSCYNGQAVYSWNQTGDGEFDLMLQRWCAGRKATVVYNVPIECDVDTEYFLPPEYCELFTLGLCLKLLGAYPRESDQMFTKMSDELKALTDAIVAKQADAKTLEWNRHDFVDPTDAFRSGSFLGV